MMMRIVVFARPVQNPAVPVEPGSARTVDELPGYAPIPSPLDEVALEAALRLREQAGFPATVAACSVGTDAARKVLREFLACGADQAVCIEEAGWEPDGAVVAARLCEFHRTEPFDLGLFGERDLDTGAGEVGPMFAALTGLPYIDSVVGIRWSGERQIDVTRRQKRLREQIRVHLPACLGILRGAPLRYPSFWGKLEADAFTLRRVSFPEACRDPRVERKKFTRSKPRKGSVAEAYAASKSVDQMRRALGITGAGGKQNEDSFLKGEPEEIAGKVLEIMKEAKIIDARSLQPGLSERPAKGD